VTQELSSVRHLYSPRRQQKLRLLRGRPEASTGQEPDSHRAGQRLKGRTRIVAENGSPRVVFGIPETGVLAAVRYREEARAERAQARRTTFM
jgi:hypothetical protein